jgi:hypothetical protein
MTTTPDTSPPDGSPTKRARWFADRIHDDTFDEISRQPLWTVGYLYGAIHADDTCPYLVRRVGFGADISTVAFDHSDLCGSILCSRCIPDSSSLRQLFDRVRTLRIAADILEQQASWMVAPDDRWRLLDAAHTDPWAARVVEHLREHGGFGPAIEHDIGILCVIDTGITDLDTYATWKTAAHPDQISWLEQLTIQTAVRDHTATRATIYTALGRHTSSTPDELRFRQKLLDEICERGQELAAHPLTRYVRTRVDTPMKAEVVHYLRGTVVPARAPASCDILVGGHPVMLDAYFRYAHSLSVDVARNDSRERAGAIVRLAAELEQTHHADTPLADLIHVASALTP